MSKPTYQLLLPFADYVLLSNILVNVFIYFLYNWRKTSFFATKSCLVIILLYSSLNFPAIFQSILMIFFYEWCLVWMYSCIPLHTCILKWTAVCEFLSTIIYSRAKTFCKDRKSIIVANIFRRDACLWYIIFIIFSYLKTAKARELI